MNPVGTKYLETERLSLRRISINDVDNLYREILVNKKQLYFLDWDYTTDM